MTESEDESTPFSKSIPRACDNCRVRKVRCDKTTPCSNCRTAGVACRITSRQNDITKPRSRVLISNQYEQKIDRLEERLGGIEKLLQTLVQATKNPPNHGHSRPSSAAFTPAASTSVVGPTPQVEQFEGESSLVAHSKQAHEALQRLLESAPITIRNDPNTVNALASLKNLLEEHRSEAPSLNLLSQDGSPQDSLYTDLPPREDVLELLAYVEADETSVMFTWWLFEDIKEFYKMYDEFCLSPSTCPLAISVLVYCTLCWLLDANPIALRAGLDTTKYTHYIPACERRLEACIASYSLFSKPTDLNIAALSAAGAYAIYTADVNAAWTLTSTAVRMCQSLGWHRLTPEKCEGPDSYERKAAVFWSVYFVDKSLSLRLGRASAMQDYDISTSLKDLCDIWRVHGTVFHQHFISWIELSVEMASIQGVIYDKLYSPGSIKGLSDRQKLGQELINRVNNVMILNERCFASPSWMFEYTEYYKECGDVILYSLFTLIYRAMPEVSNAHQLSLQAARSTMQVHYSCSKKAEVMGSGVKIEYMTWSIMLCPFTPFIVLFRSAITDLNLDDLKLLEDFVNSIEWLNDKNQRAPLQRFRELCHAFYTLAKHFVAARLRADNERQSLTSAGQMLVMGALQCPDFNETLTDITIPDDFQTWMDTHMDFMNNDWLAFGTL